MKKNNQGFTLLGVLAVAAVLSVAVIGTMAVQKYNARKADAKKIEAQTNQLASNFNSSNHSSTLEGTANMQLNNLPNANPNDSGAVEGATGTNTDTGSSNGSSNSGTASGGAPSPTGMSQTDGSPRCPSPCHLYTDNNNPPNVSCILTRIDCNCLGNCPIPPTGCIYVDDGPGDPYYQPAPDGQGNACPSHPTCNPPYVVSPRYHECRCPGDVSDCTPFGTSSGGGVRINLPGGNLSN